MSPLSVRFPRRERPQEPPRRHPASAARHASPGTGVAVLAASAALLTAPAVLAVLAAWMSAPAALSARGIQEVQEHQQVQEVRSADGAAGRTAAAPLDPVVQEVVRMLGSKVSEPVIERWIGEGHHPGVVGSRELIALKQAGASDQLTEKLLDLAARRTTTSPASGPAPAGRSAGTSLPSPGRNAAKLHWIVTYHPNFLADDVRWDLFVYLDGRYLAWVKDPLVSFLQKPLEFDASVAPGHHLLRLMEERHVRKPNTDEWDSQARVAPKPLALDVKPDAPGKVEIVLEVRPRGGPVTLQLTQGDGAPARAQPSLPLPENWQPLCEEAPAQKEPCLHWSDLWPNVAVVPSREAVRDQLERAHFRPLPAQPGAPDGPGETAQGAGDHGTGSH